MVHGLNCLTNKYLVWHEAMNHNCRRSRYPSAAPHAGCTMYTSTAYYTKLLTLSLVGFPTASLAISSMLLNVSCTTLLVIELVLNDVAPYNRLLRGSKNEHRIRPTCLSFDRPTSNPSSSTPTLMGRSDNSSTLPTSYKMLVIYLTLAVAPIAFQEFALTQSPRPSSTSEREVLRIGYAQRLRSRLHRYIDKDMWPDSNLPQEYSLMYPLIELDRPGTYQWKYPICLAGRVLASKSD